MANDPKTTGGPPRSSEGPIPLSKILTNRFAVDPEIAAAREASSKAHEASMAANRAAYARGLLERTMGTRYASCTLDNFAVVNGEQKAALASIRGYIDDLAVNVANGRGLVLYGTVGTGKDHLLAACLFKAVDAGFQVAWQNAQSVYEAARDQMDNKSGSESDLMKRFTSSDVLGLSDPTPPAGDLTGFRIELLWRIADLRYRNMKPVWMTMNANSIDECKVKLSVPLWDRLQDNALCVPCFWPSYRQLRH